MKVRKSGQVNYYTVQNMICLCRMSMASQLPGSLSQTSTKPVCQMEAQLQTIGMMVSDLLFTVLQSLEKRNYDFDGNHYCKGAGHFTQILWKSTKFIGVGVDWNSNGKVVIVVRYKPAGNRAGIFQENVSPLSTGAHISDHTPSGSSDEDIEIDNVRVGTLIQTDTDSVETVDDQGP